MTVTTSAAVSLYWHIREVCRVITAVDTSAMETGSSSTDGTLQCHTFLVFEPLTCNTFYILIH